MRYEFDYEFQPVGQGLFAFGRIRATNSESLFIWVYDCGTISSQKFVNDGLDRLAAFKVDRQPIDLVTVFCLKRRERKCDELPKEM